jgi:hypothetical protein
VIAISPRRRAAPLLLALALLGAGPRVASADELEEARKAAAKQLVRKLDGDAEWCQAERMLQERDASLVLILKFEPDHPKARRLLRYTRDPATREWKRGDHVAQKNWNLAKLPEAVRRRDDACTTYVDAVLAAVEAHGANLPLLKREALLEDLLDLRPDHERLRTELGHVRQDGVWSLPETAHARVRRKQLRDAMKAGDDLSRVQPHPATWGKLKGAKARGVEAWSTVDEDRAPLLVSTILRSELCARVVLGRSAGAPFTLTVVEMGSRAEAMRYGATLPTWTAEKKRIMESVSSMWAAPRTLLAYAANPDQNLQAVIRQSMDGMLADFDPAEARRGWITEGMGQRLCWLAHGTHGPVFISITHTETQGNVQGEDEVEIPPMDVSWLPAAARVLDVDPARHLRTLFTRTLNAMGPADALVAYALSAYLLEGREDALATMLKASENQHDPEKIVQDVFGVGLEVLAVRLRRWTREAGDA